MAKELGADSLRYLPVEAIARAVKLAPDHLCRACITGEYPTPTGQRLYQLDAGSFTGCGPPTQRAYELAESAAVLAEEA
jgi:amidophosphoribosyltransferase